MTVWRNYLLAHATDWLLLGLLAWAAVRWLDVAPSIVAVIVAVWIVKDVLMFPSARRYYASEPAVRRIVGEDGEALSRVDPAGFARVHGEIWQVHVDRGTPPIPEGTRVRVRDIDGLHLLVEPAGRVAD